MTPDLPAANHFATTHWSIILSAGQDDSAARQAFAELCRRYWYPLYAFARRTGNGVEAAQDHAQEFFTRLIEKKTLAAANPDRGRFRNFLLAAFKNFLSNERDRATTQKRGGGLVISSIDLQLGESRLSLEPVDDMTPERVFERSWVTTLMQHVLNRLRTEYSESGKATQFELFQSSLYGPREGISYADAATQLAMTEDGARQAALRLRKRYRDILREEVAATTTDESEVDDEIRRMFQTLS
jgi:RNA polymerase sigma factor (sigma-70 family)